MNADLAFCLERFADEQIVESIKEIEQDVHQLEIEQGDIKNTLNHNEITLNRQENMVVEQFSKDLQVNETNMIKNRRRIESELRDILNHASRNIDIIAAKATGKQADEDVRTASNRLRRQNEQFESEITQLIKTIDQNGATHITSWYQQHFGYLEELNKTINHEQPTFSKDILIQSSIDRQHLWEDRSKLFNEFVIQLQIDDLEISENFIDSLNVRNHNANDAIKYARSYVQQLQEERRYLKEEPLREIEYRMEQKRQEQQTRALELAGVLRQLAVGSESANQFSDRFEQILDQSKSLEKLIPIVMGHIDQPTEKELPLMMKLDADFNKWATNKSSIQEQFCSTLSIALGIPEDTIRIIRVEQGSTILYALVRPPHGKVVIEKLQNFNTDSPSALDNLDVIQKCFAKFDSRIYSITLGEFGLNVKERVMDPQWNKVYVCSYGQPGGTFWSGSLNRGGKPYFCPKGWTRFGIKVAKNEAAFDEKWGSWHIAYHGTKGVNAPLILATGLRSSISGCFAMYGRHRVYLTPSIQYAAHPRYACPWQKASDRNRWYQLVFQCRVNPTSFDKTYPETLINNESKEKTRVDENFSNDQLEWVIPAETANPIYIRDNIVCYGMMMRISECDPKDLPESKWWQYSVCLPSSYDSV